MALIGTIEAFNPKESDVVTYLERLEQLFICNDVTEEKKVSLLLTLIGGEAYSVLKDLLVPDILSEKGYEELKKELTNHYSPKRLVIAERYKFYSANQECNEDIKSFLARLKKLTKYCQFGGFLNDALRDKFVCGLQSGSIKRKLLSEDNLTFERAYHIAISMELAEGQTKVLGLETVPVNRLSPHTTKLKYGQNQGNFKVKPAQRYHQSYGSNQERNKNSCKRCLRVHLDNKCPAVAWKCYSCGDIGHTAKSRLCKNRIHGLVSEEEMKKEVEVELEDDSLELGWLQEETECGEVYNLNLVKFRGNDSLKVELIIENKSIIMEIDSGACVSVMHRDDYKKFFGSLRLEPVAFKLKVVTGESVCIVGKITVRVRYENEMFELPLVVLDSRTKFCPLLGRNWLNVINPKWKNVLGSNVSIKSQNIMILHKSNQVAIDQEVKSQRNELISEIRSMFPSVFNNDTQSCIQHFEAEITVKNGVNPIFHRAYTMPYALKPKVEAELRKMVESKVLTKIKYSKWASPIVVVPKKNCNDIRICVDFKKTLNPVIDTEHCVLPLPEDIFSSLSGSKFFSVIDLKGAYQQLKLSEASKELFTINTHVGLFRYNRLTYGVSSAPGIFQSVMEAILADLPNTKCYLDDILVYGSSIQHCHQNVTKVMSRLQEYNVNVNGQKCKFYETSVEFLGHTIDSRGVHPTATKIECIKRAPSPQNLTQLKSYLGLLNYYGKFIHTLSAKLKPLYDLCTAHTDFVWSEECEETFQMSKKLLTSSDVLAHFDPTLPIFVTCDASGYGVGAVLSHKINGEDKPVLFASSTLSVTEKRYSNLEREGLAIIFALKKFHKYLYGRKFVLITDHEPLKFIFGKNKGIPVTAAARITRWSIILSAYEYEIQYKKGKLVANADGLSRLPMASQTEIPDSIYSFSLVENIPLHAGDIAKATKQDLLLTKVVDLTLSGWPNYIRNEELKPYFQKRHGLCVENNCLLVGNKVIIPKSLQNEVLALFHEQHIGIVRTKMLIRSYCWWPGINEAIEKFIALCEICQQTQNFSSNSTLFPWPKAPNNFYRINIDFFHKYNYSFLIVVDNKSKWIDVKLMDNGTNASETILKLKEIFSSFGLPVEMVSDNGPPFNSSEFNAFCQANGIKPVKTPPYHPQSNGIAERGVQTIKKGLEKSLFLEDVKSVDRNKLLSRLASFLFTYRNTPCSTIGISPAEQLFKLRPRTRFDFLKPSYDNNEKGLNSDISRKIKLYSLNESVYVKDKQLKLWQKGKIVKIISHSSYLIQIGNSIKFVHANDIRLNPYQTEFRESNTDMKCDVNGDMIIDKPKLLLYNRPTTVPSDVDIPTQTEPEVMEVPVRDDSNASHSGTSPESDKTVTTKASQITRSGRIVKVPNRLNL